MADAQQILNGGRIASDLTAANLNGVANQFRAKMSAADIEALDAFRAHQLQTIIADIEDSEEGARIRWQAAKDAYAAHCTKAITASLQGVK